MTTTLPASPTRCRRVAEELTSRRSTTRDRGSRRRRWRPRPVRLPTSTSSALTVRIVSAGRDSSAPLLPGVPPHSGPCARTLIALHDYVGGRPAATSARSATPSSSSGESRRPLVEQPSTCSRCPPRSRPRRTTRPFASFSDARRRQRRGCSQEVRQRRARSVTIRPTRLTNATNARLARPRAPRVPPWPRCPSAPCRRQ